MGSRPRRVCFFSHMRYPEMLQRIGFYVQDQRILADLGFDVVVASSVKSIPAADLYFGWWWTWGFAPVLRAKLARKKVILTGVFDYWLFPQRPKWHQMLHAFALKHADANIFVSEAEMKEVGSHLKIRNPVYIPLTVDTQHYHPAPGPKQPIVFTVAGSGMIRGNSVRKCLAEIVRAVPEVCANFPDVRFIIAGQHGEDTPGLIELATELGVRSKIEFPGVISEEDKVHLMQTCLAYLQPSRFEGFGLGLLEAMACGAPCVSSPVGAIPEVGGDAIKLVDGTDPAQIAYATITLLEDRDGALQLGARARDRAVERFQYERRKREIERVIQQVCGYS